MLNFRLGSALPIIATIDPQTVVNSEVFTDVVDMALYDGVMAVALTGDMASETIDFKAYKCDAGGGNAVALKSATQLAAHASTNDLNQIVIALDNNEFSGLSQRYVKFGLVTGGASGGPAAVVVLGVPKYGPASARDLATVRQIKN